MHGGYRRSFGPEHLAELTKNIVVQHEDYLKHDDPDKKQDALRYMAGYAVQYLHLVPHEKKFSFKETERVLHNSAMNIGEFDPREGFLAFGNLAKYAENLLEQPWRKDFHVIKLTSGFYVHNVAAQLQNAHELLIVMGYVNIDDRTLKLLPNPSLVKLKAVSRDCYIASQECLILSQIWQHVADVEPDYPLTIGEVFEYRKNHLGDTDTICNKLLYDIRARMHAVKQQQQLSLALKQTQRFVPVDRLIDFDADDRERMNVDEPDLPFIPEREVERIQNRMKSTNLYEDDEHIYDPVYGSSSGADLSRYPAGHHDRDPYLQNQQKPSPSYFFNSRKSVPSYPPQPQHNNFNGSSAVGMMYNDQMRNSDSPMIPKTVTSLFSSGTPPSNISSNRSFVSKSNSMNSLNGRGGGVTSSSSSSSQQTYPTHNHNQPLTLSKVKETDLDAEPGHPLPPNRESSYHAVCSRTRKSAPSHIQNPNQVYPDEFYPPGIVKPVAVYGASSINYDQIVPTVQYHASAPRPRQNSDNSEDVLNEAYAYASEVNQMPKGRMTNAQRGPGGVPAVGKGGVQQIYQHQATPIPMPGSDSDSQSFSSRGTSIQRELAPANTTNHSNHPVQRTGSSTDASSWGDSSALDTEFVPGVRDHNQNSNKPSRKSEPAKRPSHIDIRGGESTGPRQWRGGAQAKSPPAPSQIRYADSSPESDLVDKQQVRNKNGYHELSSSSSGSSGSPGSSASLSRQFQRNEELSSLDTVYFDYLLKQGQTDQVMKNTNGHCEGASQQEQSRRSSSNHRHSSQQQHHQESSARGGGGGEPEEGHMYDGRRVVKKKQRETMPARLEKRENDESGQTSSRHKRIPVESNDPSIYNLSTFGESKPVPDKTLKKVTNSDSSSSSGHHNKGRQPVESEIPLPRPSKSVEPWNCRFCTFRNMKEERICEVCAKSKDFYDEDLAQPPQPVEPPPPPPPVALPKMYSVPNEIASPPPPSNDSAEEKECPQCTLLNPVRARVCDACNFRLIPVETPPKNSEDISPYDNR